MPTQETLYNVANRVATITLNRPDKLNAWTALMESEVRSHMENAEQDDEVRVIVLTGAGQGFCAGADMSLLSADRGLDDRGREQVLHNEGNRREGIRGHVATARGSFRHFRARDDGVFPHRGFQRGCRALCGEAPRCFHG